IGCYVGPAMGPVAKESENMTETSNRAAGTNQGDIPGEIPKTMQAVVCYAPGDYRLEEVEVPTPGPGEILTRVELVGICMSDVKVYHGAPSFWGDETQPRYVKPPMIPGHEFVCRVVALGEGAGQAKNVEVGDRVISEQIVPCWDCRFC